MAATAKDHPKPKQVVNVVDEILPHLYVGGITAYGHLETYNIKAILNCAKEIRHSDEEKQEFKEKYGISKDMYLHLSVDDLVSEEIERFLDIGTEFIHKCLTNLKQSSNDSNDNSNQNLQNINPQNVNSKSNQDEKIDDSKVQAPNGSNDGNDNKDNQDKKDEKYSGNMLVHCFEGKSRSVSIILGYMIKYEKITLKDGYTKIKKIRPKIRPNKGFWKSLMKYELKYFDNLKESTGKSIKFKGPKFFICPFCDKNCGLQKKSFDKHTAICKLRPNATENDKQHEMNKMDADNFSNNQN